MRNGEPDAFDRRSVIPHVDTHRALIRQRRRKHALAGGDSAGTDLFGGAVRDHPDGISVLQEPEAQLQTGLARANDRDTSLGHDVPFSVKEIGYVSSRLWA